MWSDNVLQSGSSSTPDSERACSPREQEAKDPNTYIAIEPGDIVRVGVSPAFRLYGNPLRLARVVQVGSHMLTARFKEQRTAYLMMRSSVKDNLGKPEAGSAWFLNRTPML